MLALRRASSALFRNQRLKLGTLHSYATVDTPSTYIQEGKFSIIYYNPRAITDRSLQFTGFNYKKHFSSRPCTSRHSFSSQAGEKDDDEEEDGVDAGLPELESEPCNEDTSQNELDLLETKTNLGQKRSITKKAHSELFKVIMDTPSSSIRSVLDKWVVEGKDLSQEEISHARHLLHKQRLTWRGLQFLEWLVENKKVDMDERYYATRLDATAKLYGTRKAEKYFETIPESFIGSLTYQSLLAMYASAKNVKKGEQVFNKMKDLGFSITPFVCNQLLFLFKQVARNKIPDLLLFMEKENVEFTLFTYKMLIGLKGKFRDLAGIDQLVEKMKEQGIEPDIRIQAILVRLYYENGLAEKAEQVLKEMEGGNLKNNQWACRFLLHLYAMMKKSDEVRRIWDICEPDPSIAECVSVILAWGKLNNIEKAEEVFHRMSKKWQTLTSLQYSVMLNIYADHKMVAKGKDLTMKMLESGGKVYPLACKAIVKLYVGAGEVEVADSILQKMVKRHHVKPLFTTYVALLEEYAKKGDVHSAENVFRMMRQMGYVARLVLYRALIGAYLNADAPAYGMRERMMADEVFPDKDVAGKLARVDPFRRTSISHLLD